MLSSRYVPGQSSSMRKSRLEGKPSLLPKPRRPGSTDRLSTEARRPSAAGHRSSSAEPRGTFGGGRLSREASATKLPLNGRSRSQQGDRYGQATTPLRSSHYASRPTTTPVRTPTEERARNWQASLDRALSFVTKKDQRPISNVAWQRAENARVSEALAARGAAAGLGGSMALIRPLTIARFVDITGALLTAITKDTKLNNDNYVTKMPHLSKRLLYPGVVSKSWLKTVNTLHAFPHALALIAYLLDLVNHIEMPVTNEWLYVGKDDLSRLRIDYLEKCWIRFQESDHQFEDLNEEYLLSLRNLLGNDEEKIAELQKVIQNYQICLEDEAEAAARADEARRSERRDNLLTALRTERAARMAAKADIAAQLAARNDHGEALRTLDVEIERATAESQQLKQELESQAMCIADRTRLLDEVDYSHRVLDSKRALAEQIAKMLLTKETELALWQKKTLATCVEFKQGLIHLSGQFPDLAQTIDEKDLMGAECALRVTSAVERLRAQAATLAERRSQHARERTAKARRRANLLEEARNNISELKSSVTREQESLDTELSTEAADAVAAQELLKQLTANLDILNKNQETYAKADSELEFWEKQDAAWTSKLSEMREYIVWQRANCERALLAARDKRVAMVSNCLAAWNQKIAQ